MSDIEKVRQKKREYTGWTLEEIKNNAQQERGGYKKLSEYEPDGLVSGKDMKAVVENKDAEQDNISNRHSIVKSRSMIEGLSELGAYLAIPYMKSQLGPKTGFFYAPIHRNRYDAPLNFRLVAELLV